jgi:hypothetical protein
LKATLGIEAIGEMARLRFEDTMQAIAAGRPGALYKQIKSVPPPCWVDKITYTGRERLVARRDYSQSNNTGSRGIYLWYILESENVYEVQARTSQHQAERYFCRVTDDGDIVRISKEEADEWIKGCSASTC